MAGIIDTIENPCCCKLLVDLEWISIKQRPHRPDADPAGLLVECVSRQSLVVSSGRVWLSPIVRRSND